MEGVDSDWVEIGNRTHVDFPSLDPGEYTFRVIGSNNDGVWNEEGAWVDIVIKPPFWLTWWFRGGLITIFLISLVGAYRIRINQMAARNLELETEVEKRTVELRQEIDQRIEAEQALLESEREKAVLDERNRLARELHDAVTQTLFSASLLAEAIPKSWQEDPAEAEMLLNDLRQLSRGALAEMRTLLLELRPAVLADVEMRELLRQLTEAAGARENIKFHLESEEESKLPLDVHFCFYRIAQEALNNIVKHAQCENVTIIYKAISNAVDQPLEVELNIRDDGVGFDLTKTPPERMGLGIMQERAQSIGADLSISSQEGQGTRVQLNWVISDFKGNQDD
jgi:signal transduction histidine kinase